MVLDSTYSRFPADYQFIMNIFTKELPCAFLQRLKTSLCIRRSNAQTKGNTSVYVLLIDILYV